MIDVENFEKINKITDPYEAAKEYLLAVSRYMDNCDTASNEIIFEDLEYRFVRKWAEIVVSLLVK